MTRLTSSDLKNIGPDWTAYQQRLTGMLKQDDLLSLAAMAADRPAKEVRASLSGQRLAAVSISSGEGVVSSFAQSMASIGQHLGLSAQVMTEPDEAGMAQAEKWGADIAIYANDDQYLARNLKNGQTADNNPATSLIYVAALQCLAGKPLAGQEVLVLGMGIIGRTAAARLIKLGAHPLMYDPDEKQQKTAPIAGQWLPDQEALAQATKRTNLIFDATPTAQALAPELWPDFPIVTAPGVPLAWPPQWLDPGANGKLWHDPLESGTAAMLALLAGAPQGLA